MQEVRRRLIHLHRCRGITRLKLRRFLKYDATLKSIYFLTEAELQQQFLFTASQANYFLKDLHSQVIKNELKMDLQKYQVLTILDKAYPFMLKQIVDPPLVLYAIGDIKLLQNKAISVIGTRQPSNEARQKTEFIVKPLVGHKLVIVSGMAKGIDRFAHETALKYNGNTIAVLGSGFNYIYPRENKELFHQIANKNVVVSEYPPKVRPAKYHFPERNRIVSGLSFATVVIEAKEKSGTLITVGQALDQGREIYVVPGSVFNEQTIGCHQLIQQGAKLIYDASEIISDFEQIKDHFYG